MTIQRHLLSKSTFIRGCQCQKSLYLYKHFYDLRDEISEEQQAIFTRGISIGELAQQLFPNGINVQPETPFEYQKSVLQTQSAIAKGENVIYEAAFQFERVLVAVDILVKEKGKWKAYEVKSSTSISDTYILDTALQYYVITSSGIELEDISVVYINNTYVRQGELDIKQLFTIESVLNEVKEKQDFVKEKIEELKSVILLKDVPKIDIGTYCSDPYDCDYSGYCWKHIPEISVFNISRLTADKKFKLYYDGIIEFKDIPKNHLLNESQWQQVESYLTNKDFIDKKAIKGFLKSITFPLYFMDFETFMPAVPMFDNAKPYQQITFQYSLHYHKSEDSELKHFEFLAEAKGDPRPAFIERLIADTKGKGDILVYNQAFEITRLKEIARDFPKYAGSIENIISRVIDLMIPFQNKYYYKPEMLGSYSIKKVLPALVPEMSYDEMEINNGGIASASFEQMYYDPSEENIKATRENLLEYCGLDTMAMVKILEKLYKYYE
jgi:hypothetical protein